MQHTTCKYKYCLIISILISIVLLAVSYQHSTMNKDDIINMNGQQKVSEQLSWTKKRIDNQAILRYEIVSSVRNM